MRRLTFGGKERIDTTAFTEAASCMRRSGSNFNCPMSDRAAEGATTEREGRATLTSPAPWPETIDKLASSVYPSFAMLAGMQLDLFTPLRDGSMNGEQVAEALGVRPDKLKPLLYALVAAGLLMVEGDLFSNTPEADTFLVRDRRTYIGGRHQAIRERWDGVLKTAETIRTGVPQAKSDIATMSAERMESLARSRETESVAAGRDLLARYDFSSHRTLLDVGGGAGYFSIFVTETYPNLRATVVDLPRMTPLAQRVVSEAGAADRVQVMRADIVNESLEGSFDVAVLRSFIQVLSADQARRALLNVGEVIKPGGTIYILGRIIDDSRVSPLETVGYNLRFLNIYDEGQAYTEQEYRDWLTEAGFEGFERVVVPNGTSIVRARKQMQA